MKTSFLYVLMLVMSTFSTLCAQQVTMPSESNNGVYHISFDEPGLAGQTMKVHINLGKTNDLIYLKVGACRTCKPNNYYYMKKQSKKFGRPNFASNERLMITYDDESYIIFNPKKKDDSGNYETLNFYSKSQEKVRGMNKQTLMRFLNEMISKLSKGASKANNH